LLVKFGDAAGEGPRYFELARYHRVDLICAGTETGTIQLDDLRLLEKRIKPRPLQMLERNRTGSWGEATGA
jgi:hypothetical protein